MAFDPLISTVTGSSSQFDAMTLLGEFWSGQVGISVDKIRTSFDSQQKKESLMFSLAGRLENRDGADPLGREAKPPSPPNEAERPNVILVLGAVTTVPTGRRGDRPHLLEVADRLDVDASAPRKLAYRDARHDEKTF